MKKYFFTNTLERVLLFVFSFVINNAISSETVNNQGAQLSEGEAEETILPLLIGQQMTQLKNDPLLPLGDHLTEQGKQQVIDFVKKKSQPSGQMSSGSDAQQQGAVLSLLSSVIENEQQTKIMLTQMKFQLLQSIEKFASGARELSTSPLCTKKYLESMEQQNILDTNAQNTLGSGAIGAYGGHIQQDSALVANTTIFELYAFSHFLKNALSEYETKQSIKHLEVNAEGIRAQEKSVDKVQLLEKLRSLLFMVQSQAELRGCPLQSESLASRLEKIISFTYEGGSSLRAAIEEQINKMSDEKKKQQMRSWFEKLQQGSEREIMSSIIKKAVQRYLQSPLQKKEEGVFCRNPWSVIISYEAYVLLKTFCQGVDFKAKFPLKSGKQQSDDFVKNLFLTTVQ